MAITTVQTLFGSLDETQLKALKGAIEEINTSMQQIEFKNNEIKFYLVCSKLTKV